MGAVLGLLPMLIVTAGGIAMLTAFLLFGKRRRNNAPTEPDDVLAANAALGAGLFGSSGLVPAAAPAALPAPRPAPVPAAAAPKALPAPVAEAAQAAVQGTVVAVPVGDVDAHLPRWRRPSLMEARKNDPTRSVSAAVRLAFDAGVVAATTGMERRLIRYRLVSLLDSPDEVRGVEIGVLDEGDEVVLMEKRGTFWRVLCPDGREGWLHKMTLGDVVIDATPGGAGSWASADEGAPAGGFEEVMRAYSEGYRQFGDA